MRLKNYLIHQVETSGVEVKLNTKVTPDFIRAGGYEAVILATGSSPARPPIPGLDEAQVMHATEIYTRGEALGKEIAVLGGGLVGCETGLYLAQKGHKVTIVEMQDQIAPEANWMHKEGMRQAFEQAQIVCRTGLRVSRVQSGVGVTAVDRDGQEVFLPADSIVYAMGMRSNTDSVLELRDVCPETCCVGDCVRPRKARQAIEEGYWAAVRLF
jgi:pyruvate/2-oxoglutarate dehydrogenase complex dihydrolipoamide dehydrogenase (E3) component